MRKKNLKPIKILINSFILAIFLAPIGCGMSGLNSLSHSGEIEQNGPDVGPNLNTGDPHSANAPADAPPSAGPPSADGKPTGFSLGSGGAAAPTFNFGGGGSAPVIGSGPASPVDIGSPVAAPLCPPPCSGADTKSSYSDNEHILEPSEAGLAAAAEGTNPLATATTTPAFH